MASTQRLRKWIYTQWHCINHFGVRRVPVAREVDVTELIGSSRAGPAPPPLPPTNVVLHGNAGHSPVILLGSSPPPRRPDATRQIDPVWFPREFHSSSQQGRRNGRPVGERVARWGRSGQVKPTAIPSLRLARCCVLATRINAATNKPKLSIDRVGTRHYTSSGNGKGSIDRQGSSPAQPPAAAPRFSP
jgi:hypothetical protein